MIPYGRQFIEDDDIAAVVDVLRSDYLTQGPVVEAFERAFAPRVGSKYAVAVNSGTAALHACMMALEIGPGDEVIVPPITFTATVNCVIFVGGSPVFADVTPSGHIDPEQIERKITKKTKAVIAVDYAGCPCDYGRILGICERHGLALVCDACHALGAMWNGRPVGSIGRLNTFSFHPVKHIATGEGGMITTEDAELAGKMREFRTHGITKDAARFKGVVSEVSVPPSHSLRRTGQGSGKPGESPEHRTLNTELHIPQSPNLPINQLTLASLRETGPWYYEMQSLGYNYRMPDINAALGLSQVKKLDRFVTRRREIAKEYYEGLANVPFLRLPVSDLNLPTTDLRPQTTDPKTIGNQALMLYPEYGATRGGSSTKHEARSNQHSIQPSDFIPPPSTHSFHLFPVLIDFAALGKSRTRMMDELRAKGVGTQVHYIPVCLQPYYRDNLGVVAAAYPAAEQFYAGELSLPMYAAMSNTQASHVINAVRSVLEW